MNWDTHKNAKYFPHFQNMQSMRNIKVFLHMPRLKFFEVPPNSDAKGHGFLLALPVLG